METHNEDLTIISSSSNWSIPAAAGSLASHVTVESSLSPVDDDDPHISPAKSSLVLRPSSPDSGPCEITINFTQMHEVQQVYVRSTARVYEVYYAPDLQSDNEYLCTVRCGIATRDEEVLLTADNEEAVSATSNGSPKDLPEENLRNDNSLSTREDDWVEVKVPDSLALDKNISSLSSKSGSKQAFYEATAQMSDLNPCKSLTLRLLSLEKKDCVYVDEIYVFADPADSTGLENQASTSENSAGSSLMAMFMPTLLQLSKTRRLNQTKDSEIFGSEASLSTGVAGKIETDTKPSIPAHREVQFQDVNSDTVGSTQLQIPLHVPVTERKSDSAYHHEKSLDLLFSRISRIEDLLLGFEEKMVKPVSSIEARLERVEQQLEVLSKQSQNSGLSTCSRFCAPSFSCIESDSNSLYNSGIDYPSCEAVMLGSKDAQSEAVPTAPHEMSDSVNSTKLVPGLVVTAPEFSSEDEEEEHHSSGVVINTSENTPRPALTIDDALASALAGFMSLTSSQPQKYTQAFLIKAPDFLNEEDGSLDTKASATVEDIGTDPSICFHESDGVRDVKDSTADSSNITLNNDGVSNANGCTDEHSVNPDRIHAQHQHDEGREEDKLDGNNRENAVDPASHGMAQTDFVQIMEEIKNGVVCSEVSNTANPEKTEIPSVPPKETDDGFNNIYNDANTKEVTEESCDKDVLKNILQFSHASSVVDFEIPVLDVKFASLESGSATCSLAALLSESPESMTEAPYVRESDDAPITSEGSSLILMDDGKESVSPAPDGTFSVDMDFYSVAEPSITWGANLQCDTSTSHESFSASLI